MKAVLLVLFLTLVASQQVVPSQTCISCQVAVQTLETAFGNASTVAKILDYLDEQCKNKTTDPQMEALCEAAAAIFVQIPPAIFDGLESLAWNIPIGLCAFLMQCEVLCCNTKFAPEQVHLSLTGDPTEMGVTWVTLNVTNTSTVQYGPTPTSLTSSGVGSWTTYKWGGWLGTIHTAKMTGLKPATTYYYRVGDDAERGGWSEIFNFTTLSNDPTVPIRFAVIGDMDFGPASDNTVAQLIEDVNSNAIDIVIHVGDISYADGYEYHWDVFFNKIQPIASRVPYMVSPGNHEFWFNFTSYKARFFMPGVSSSGGSGDNMFYSYNVGNIHFISLNSETAVDTAWFKKDEQMWLENDLKSVDRKQYPWIIAHWHRPMYCSNNNKGDCVNMATILRDQAEDIIYKYKVDLVIYGHVHDYERTYPMYQGQVMSTSYDNAPAPVYIVNGAGGNREGNSHNWPNPPPDWSVFRSGSVGFAHMTVNGGGIAWSFFQATNTSRILEDEFKMTKTL